MTSRAEGYALLQIPDMERRLANVASLGTVTETDYSDAKKPRVRVKIGKQTTGWLAFSTGSASGNGEWNPLHSGEQVVLLAPSGDLAQAVIVGRVNSNNAQAPDTDPNVTARTWEDGAREEYNRQAHAKKITVPDGGSIQFAVGNSSLTINSDSITLSVGGKSFTLGSSGWVGNADVVADGVSLVHHIHPGVRSGSDKTQEPEK